MITCTAIVFIVLFFVTRSEKKKIQAENVMLKGEINRLNNLILELQKNEKSS